ncbi:hypothetical protein JOC54_003116 [Alkalihalobacillus xiaoxiensis]|uniref:Lipoprotein n=1 Tax=Shouchella xiaoxiensis TaxID=766895 RepID=A0ABS2SXB1_9BACI|nr:hypothetical protein [Shouchella xiaoxiensis]MBM7839836.1 hypothetical protein [Shouchella xiaoxiensis]
MIKKGYLIIGMFIFVLAACSSDDNDADRLDEIPSISVYVDEEEVSTNAHMMCWNDCDQSEPDAINAQEEAEGLTAGSASSESVVTIQVNDEEIDLLEQEPIHAMIVNDGSSSTQYHDIGGNQFVVNEFGVGAPTSDERIYIVDTYWPSSLNENEVIGRIRVTFALSLTED